MAVDAISSSPHPTNKISATLSFDGWDADEAVTATNYWPKPIEQKIGTQIRIGNSSGTVHAESACILKAKATKDANLFITDPPCPNCAKNIAEAGIKNLYIDHKGFEKDFAKRRGDDFKNMSMRIFKAAGINVFELRRKEQKLIQVLKIPDTYVAVSEFPVQIYAQDKNFTQEIKAAALHYKNEPFALCIAKNNDEQNFVLHARRHPTIGYTQHDDLTKEGKYSFILQPVNRLLMAACFYGLRIDDHQIFSSRTPTAREFVNMVGAGIQNLTIGSMHEPRDEYCTKAMNQLKEADILKIETYKNEDVS